ncbi:MAG TPA: beta-ketoacyl-ACP synthase [Arenimonas sp.]|nr:beta-ketoacyl-ACP synthase [Arenimonas sp.]
MSAVFLNELGLACALGRNRQEVAQSVFAADAPRGVAICEQLTPGRPLALGRVPGELPSLAHLPVAMHGRNNALLTLALEPIRASVEGAIARFGRHRVAIVVGTSTSGVGESEVAQRDLRRDGRWPDGFHYAQQEMGTPAQFLSTVLGVSGPAQVISTACSSSAKALATAARLLRSGMADAVLAGGADSLCAFTIAGFSALGSVSAARCDPFSRNRCGINIGEGAALFLMTRDEGPVRLAGWGESSDAHHMSAPDPTGRGAESAIDDALRRAGITSAAIDYVNLHGTATPHNDAMEAMVMNRLLPADTPMSSTKPLTGHALGAAGAIEAALCWISLAENPQRRRLPHWWDGEADPDLPGLHLVSPGESSGRALRYALSQSFAFGGSNAALVLGAE